MGTPMGKDKPKISRAQRAAAEQRAAARKERAREWLIVSGVVVAVLAVVLAVVLWPEGDDDRGTTADSGSNAPRSLEIGDIAGEVTDEYGFAFGDPGAEHRVVIYEDFLCPYCAQLETTTNNRLVELVDAGEVIIEYRVFNLLAHVGDYSLRAANAMAVVTQQSDPRVAKIFHDLLFADQPSESGTMPDNEWLIDRAVVAGADEESVRDGIENLSFSSWVEEATQSAIDDGIDGTPRVFVDGQEVGGATIDDLSDQIFERVG